MGAASNRNSNSSSSSGGTSSSSRTIISNTIARQSRFVPASSSAHCTRLQPGPPAWPGSTRLFDLCSRNCWFKRFAKCPSWGTPHPAPAQAMSQPDWQATFMTPQRNVRQLTRVAMCGIKASIMDNKNSYFELKR